MPTPDYFVRYFPRKPKLVRKENEMTYAYPSPLQRNVKVKGTPADLMTPQEVKDRLAAGEDPLLLSIEHWVQNAAWIKEHGSLPRESYRSKTCALFITYADDHGECQCTKKWPFGISQGRTCGGFSLTAVGPWVQFNRDPSYDNAMNMVATLASLKPPEPVQFYIDGGVALRLEQGDDRIVKLRATKDHLFWYYLLDIYPDGTVRLTGSVNPDLGLDLDGAGRLNLEV